jgi:hypothetical protein
MKVATRWLSGILLAGLILVGSGAPAPAQDLQARIASHGDVSAAAAVGVGRGAAFAAHPYLSMDLVCHDRAGRLVWTRHVPHNMLTTAGANLYLTDTITAGVSSPTWFVSLLYGSGAPTFAIADTLASNGWSPSAEVTGTQVTNASRPALVWGAVASGSVNNSGSVAVFTGNATVTLQGLIVVNNSTLTGTTGTLLGEATFTAAPIAAGYTITVTVTDNVTPG